MVLWFVACLCGNFCWPCLRRSFLRRELCKKQEWASLRSHCLCVAFRFRDKQEFFFLSPEVEKWRAGQSGLVSVRVAWLWLQWRKKSFQKMNTLNNEISAASQQQSDGINQISQALNDIDHATQKNASSSEELSSTSEAMNSQSQELKNIVHHLALYVSGKNAA